MIKDKIHKMLVNFDNDKNFKYFLAVGLFLGMATGYIRQYLIIF
jgi:hypothetical protein